MSITIEAMARGMARDLRTSTELVRTHGGDEARVAAFEGNLYSAALGAVKATGREQTLLRTVRAQVDVPVGLADAVTAADAALQSARRASQRVAGSTVNRISVDDELRDRTVARLEAAISALGTVQAHPDARSLRVHLAAAEEQRLAPPPSVDLIDLAASFLRAATTTAPPRRVDPMAAAHARAAATELGSLHDLLVTIGPEETLSAHGATVVDGKLGRALDGLHAAGSLGDRASAQLADAIAIELRRPLASDRSSARVQRLRARFERQGPTIVVGGDASWRTPGRVSRLRNAVFGSP